VRRRRLVALIPAVLLFVAACGVGTKTVEPPTEPRTVRIEILEGRGESTLAMAPVKINGQGPFSFALDTGAANSVIDVELAGKLDLRVVNNSRHTVRGVGGRTVTQLVEISDLKLEDIALPSAQLSAVEVPGQLGQAGLLGSDVLKTFGSVTVDYDGAVLRLGTPGDSG